MDVPAVRVNELGEVPLSLTRVIRAMSSEVPLTVSSKERVRIAVDVSMLRSNPSRRGGVLSATNAVACFATPS